MDRIDQTRAKWTKKDRIRLDGPKCYTIVYKYYIDNFF